MTVPEGGGTLLPPSSVIAMVSSEQIRVRPASQAARPSEWSPTTWGLLALAAIAVIVALSAFVPGVPAPPH